MTIGEKKDILEFYIALLKTACAVYWLGYQHFTET